jgi:large conductance mechanosensitive channel
VIQEFREFLLRGNLVQLAVAVVIGTAFTAVVKALTDNLITPLIALIGGKPDFSDLAFTISDTRFTYGLFLNAVIAFLIVAAVVFFLVVKPFNALMARVTPEKEKDTRDCPECLSSVPVAATRCAHCTSVLTPA